MDLKLKYLLPKIISGKCFFLVFFLELRYRIKILNVPLSDSSFNFKPFREIESVDVEEALLK